MNETILNTSGTGLTYPQISLTTTQPLYTNCRSITTSPGQCFPTPYPGEVLISATPVVKTVECYGAPANQYIELVVVYGTALSLEAFELECSNLRVSLAESARKIKTLENTSKILFEILKEHNLTDKYDLALITEVIQGEIKE